MTKNNSPHKNDSDSDEVLIQLEDILEQEKKVVVMEKLIFQYVKSFTATVNPVRFPNSPSEVSDTQKILERLRKYEEDVKSLQQIVLLLAKWGKGEELELLEKVLVAVSEHDKNNSGLTFLNDLEWYPLMILMYSAGVSAIANKNYEALKVVLKSESYTGDNGAPQALLVSVVAHMVSAGVQDWFKKVPGYEKHYVPRSEYLFNQLQPVLESSLFLKKRYEKYFDEFEVLFALAYIDETRGAWGPIGRFGYKHHGGRGEGPYRLVMKKMQNQGRSWEVLKIGLFDDDEEFKNQVNEYTEKLNGLHWF